MKKKRLLFGISLLFTFSSLLAQSSWKDISNKENAPDVATEASYALTPRGEFVVMYDDRSSYGEQRAKVKRYNGTKWTDLGAEAISEGRAIDIAIAEFNGKIYASYKDWPGNKTHIMCYEGNAWKKIGDPIDDASDSRLLAANNKLYRAYYSGSRERIAVFVLDGTAWKELGTAAPLEKDSRFPFDIAVNSNNELYIAYTNPLDIKQAKLRKLAGDKWVDEGPQATSYTVKHIKLAFEGNTPYIAVYSDKDYNIYVKKLVSNAGKYTWMPVGGEDGLAIKDFDDQLNFAIAGGKPHLVYEQSGTDKMRGMTLDNNSWTPTGYLADDTDAGAATKMLSTMGKVYALFKDPNRNGLAIMELPAGK
jgi:hypothetical protein